MVLLATMVLVSVGQKITYPDNWNAQGITLKSSDRGGVNIGFSLGEFTFSPVEVSGRGMFSLETPGFWLPNDAGAPNLPGKGRLVAIPEGAVASLVITARRTETYDNVDVAPAPAIPLDTDKGPLQYTFRQDIYSRDAFYPESPVTLSGTRQIRGVDAVMIGITPFQYNPVTKQLIVYRDLEISIVISGGNGHYGEERLRSRFWDPVLSDVLLNADVLPAIDYGKKAVQERSSNGCEYLIIVPNSDEYMTYAEQIRSFRIKEGITTDIVTLEEIGGNSAGTIEAYINNAYYEWDPAPAAILIMGDYGANAEINVTAPVWNSYCVSDNIFGDVNQDDLPDIVMARMTANNISQLETFVSKFINYETEPPTSSNFYNHPITALGWQTERWFQLCSEIVGGYFKNVHGKDPVRINEVYSGNPSVDPWSTAQNTGTILAEFGPQGLGYIPATPQELGGWAGGNASMINNAINSGSFMLQHRDHGEETGWGEPSYHNSDINGLTNTDLTFIFSINCLTGKYNWNSECFAEKFHRHKYGSQNSGALAIIAASEISYSFVNDTYVWGMLDNMWPDFMPEYGSTPEPRGMLPAFGNAAGKYFLEQSSWPYNSGDKTVTYHLFHHHGDAFLNLYSEVPQQLTILHDGIILAGLDQFTITADPGSIICLTVQDQIIALEEGTGSPQVLSIMPQEVGTDVVLTVKKENYFRHEEVIDVIPADGPYCIYSSHLVEDEAGNGNGIADYNEMIGLDMEMRNVGLDDGHDVNVNIASSDPYVTLLDNHEFFGNIPSGGKLDKPGAFFIQIAENIPDQHKVFFTLTASDSANTWNSTFMIRVNAPVLHINNLVIDDGENGNGNGKLDPGEQASMTVRYSNSGHAVAYDIDVAMEGQSGFVEIANPEQHFTLISFLGTYTKTYEVTVDEDAPEGIRVNFVNDLTMGNLFMTKIFDLKISALCEDFETGDFSKFDWDMEGNAPWQIISQYPFEGMHSAKSGMIGNNETSELEISYEVMTTDSIVFYRKISSAEGDELKFYIGNTMMGHWSGMKSWTREAFEVTPGVRNFRWVYSKNSSGTDGSDCGWLDMVILPSPMVLSLWAGPDSETCAGGPFAVSESYGTDFAGILWETSGTGNFDNNAVMHPAYSPSPDDIATGEVMLMLTLWNDQGDTVTDAMMLSILNVPQAPAVPQGPDYIDLFITTTSDYSTTGTPGTTEYVWALEPEESGTIEGQDTLATVTWNPEYLGTALVSIAGINGCGTGSYSSLEVTLDNTVGIKDGNPGEKRIRINPNPAEKSIEVSIPGDPGQKAELKLFNLLGETIYHKETNQGSLLTVSLENFRSGIYIVMVKGTGLLDVKKVVKK